MVHSLNVQNPGNTVLASLAQYQETGFSARLERESCKGRELSREERSSAGELRFATMNVNSVYGREAAICDTMLKMSIACLGVQEPMLRASAAPKGLFRSSYSKVGENGRRGLMWIIHPGWAPWVEEVLDLPSGDHPNILWIRVRVQGGDWYAATVYFPNDAAEAKQTIEELLKDLDQLPADAVTIIAGDMNGDPFQRKGTNTPISRLYHCCSPILAFYLSPAPTPMRSPALLAVRILTFSQCQRQRFTT